MRGQIAKVVLVAAIAAILALTIVLVTSTVRAHDWYTDLKNPAGQKCCGVDDCSPVDSRWNAEAGEFEILIGGDWLLVDRNIVVDEPALDQDFHACIWAQQLRCIIEPAFGA